MESEIKTCRNSETVLVDFKNKRQSVVLGLISTPPNLDTINSKIRLFDEITKAFRSDSVCTVGDFNFKIINWENLACNAEAINF